MAENSFRKTQKEIPTEIPKSDGKSFFQMLETSLGLDKIMSSGLPVDQFPKIGFVLLLVVFYIANVHYAEKVVRKTLKLKNEVEDLRADYTTMKAELMFKSKQSEVAKSVSILGLNESLKPPGKIEISENETKLLP